MSILSDRSSVGASPGSVNRISVLPTCSRSPLASVWRVDPLAVDEGAVGAAQVDDRVDVPLAADFGVPARDFGVVDLDEVRRVSAETHHPVFQLELRPLVATRDDK